MNIPNIGGLLSVAKSFTMANRPEILFGASVVGTLVSVVAAARGGYEARGIVEKAQHPSVDFDSPEVEVSLKEKAQLTWLCYLPAAAGTAGSLATTTGLHLVHIQEKKMLAAACLMAIDEVKKEAGEYKKELTSLGFTMSEDPEELEKAADKDGVAKLVSSDGYVEEMFLVRDANTGRDRWANKRIIEDAVSEVNTILSQEGEASLNLFYSYAGFNDLPDGEQWGWAGGTKLQLRWDTDVRDDGLPVRKFTFRPAPKQSI